MFFTDVSIVFESREESFYHCLCCEDALRKSFCSKAFISISLLDSLYADNLVQQSIQGILDIANKKNTKFSCNKTIFLNFYKTKDYFFDLIIKTKDLCAQYVWSWETPEACTQKCSSKMTNTFLEEHRWGTPSGTFGNVVHYFSAISPFSKMATECSGFDVLW